MSVSEVVIPLPMIVIQVGGEGQICEQVERETNKGTNDELFEGNTGEQISIVLGNHYYDTQIMGNLSIATAVIESS